MALVSCRECTKEVSSEAKTCPHCGIDNPAYRPAPVETGAGATKLADKGLFWFLGGGVAIIYLVSLMAPESSYKPIPLGTSAEAQKNADAYLKKMREAGRAEEKDGVLSIAQTPKLEQALSNWSYGKNDDGMSGKSSSYAVAQSNNSVNLDFPYKGEQHATLMIRKHPRYGRDIIFRIDRGQVLCNTYNCRVSAKFDDSPAMRLNGNPPEDMSTTTIFIGGAKAFMAKLKTAKKVRIEVGFYQNGNQVFEFDIAGFDEKKL